MRTILIVDDEKDILEMLTESVSRWGYRPVVANDGFEALKKIKKMHVDLVLTDLRMPKMNGIELLEKAKEISPETLFIIFTGFGTVENAVEALKIGASDYLLKPVDLDELYRKVQSALRKHSHKGSTSLIRTLNWALIVSIPIWLVLSIILIKSIL